MIATYMFRRFGIQWHIPVRMEQEEILTYLYWSLTTKEKTEGVSFSGDGVPVLQTLHHINWRFYDHYIATLQFLMPWSSIGDHRGEWKAFWFYDNNSPSYATDNSGLMQNSYLNDTCSSVFA